MVSPTLAPVPLEHRRFADRRQMDRRQGERRHLRSGDRRQAHRRAVEAEKIPQLADQIAPVAILPLTSQQETTLERIRRHRRARLSVAASDVDFLLCLLTPCLTTCEKYR